MEKIIIIVIAVTLLILFFGVIIIAYALAYQKRKNTYFLEKKAMEVAFESTLMQTQIEIQEQTLKNIAQEIHDNIGQVLILAKLNLMTFPPFENPEIDTKVGDTRQLVAKAINDLRTLSRSLHGDKISEVGLYESVSNQVQSLQNSGQFNATLSVSGTRYRLSAQKEMILFRIVQESINNSIKHSGASQIDVNLQYDAGSFCLTISDNGTGFNLQELNSATTGIGLKNMRDRAELIGGSFSLVSAPGEGTSIIVSLQPAE